MERRRRHASRSHHPAPAPQAAQDPHQEDDRPEDPRDHLNPEHSMRTIIGQANKATVDLIHDVIYNRQIPDDVDDSTIFKIANGLLNLPTRDIALAYIYPLEIGKARLLWEHALTVCTREGLTHLTPALHTLRGWTSWVTGDMKQADRSLHDALAAQPTYSMAQLLHKAIVRSLPPARVSRAFLRNRDEFERDADPGTAPERPDETEPAPGVIAQEAASYRATELLMGLGSCTCCTDDIGRAAFNDSAELLLRILEAGPTGEQHLVCSIAVGDDSLVYTLHATRKPDGAVQLDPDEAYGFTTVLALGRAAALPGGLVSRTDATPDGRDRIYGWRLAGYRLDPLTAGEIFNAYCTDTKTGDLISPECNVDYCVPPPLDEDGPAPDHTH
ncbi:DUF4192 domain-containing protein [Streptomyces europaeiscabiei]|uniref:DUF4192 family protein n=1 Tax=Streptomyces europaeiscabiei TaxID=146819 RepID=UPI002E18F076